MLEHFVEVGTIDRADLDLCLLTDSVDEALEYIHTHTIERFGLTRRPMRPSFWLHEGEGDRVGGRRAGANPRSAVTPAVE